MGKIRYRRGAHTATDFKYHFVWKIKYISGILRGEPVLRLRDIIREICAVTIWDEPEPVEMDFSSDSSENLDDFQS